FDLGTLRFENTGQYHRGRSARARANGNVVAEFGQIPPDLANARKLKQEIYIAQIYINRLLALPLRAPRYQPLSKFPAVDRDFSFVFPDGVSFEQLQSAVSRLEIADLQSFAPVEIFRGGAIQAGKYSILLRAQFQSLERTLRDDEVGQWSREIMRAL